MCGHFGGINLNGLTPKEVGFIANLGMLSQFRGRDSTGIAVVKRMKKNYGYAIEKNLFSSNVFFELPDTLKFLKTNHSPQLLIGHTRAATHGVVNVENAHPFKAGNIVGAHNGCFSMWEDKKQDKSDSYLFFEEFANSNIRDMLDKARKGARCAFALVYFDFSDLSLNMVRNSERTLYRVDSDDGKSFFWASDKAFLDLAARFTDLKLGNPCYLLPNKLYKYRFSDQKPQWFLEDLPEPVKVVPKWEPKNDWKNETYQAWWHKNNPPKKDKKKEEPKGAQIILLEDKTKKSWVSYKAHNGEVWDITKAAACLSKGCYGCRNVKTVQDDVYWRTNTSYLCSSCYTDPLYVALETTGSKYSELFFKSQVIVEAVRKKEA